jgi:hypothetical protein
MVLLKIHPHCISLVKLERNAPRPVHVNRVAGWALAAQYVEIEPRQIHVLRRLSPIQGIQPTQGPSMQPAVDSRRRSSLPELFEPFASEIPDHPQL